ncbi:flagellar hook-associated protein FlgL [Thermocrinis minervae]|uniref:Flagellar hook-associated protein 3 FlgL n=1 Tax=Thermocrinis minervae TaxID=381751 RepID=A0A1M6S2N5_9AQUI|nr:flagellar hook-associated protein FlgL [Thermocrinis minervae]SHK39102.1 flagellar hook-associated protein 3 FlgL [Thermocrinis minervae]
MKVPDNLLFSLFVEQDASIRKKLEEKTLEISTGRRLQHISDDPGALLNITDLKKEIAQLSEYAQKRLFADTNLSFIDKNLGNVENELKNLYSLTLQAKNSTVDVNSLTSTSQAFYKALSFILDTANDKIGQNYLFGGSSLTTKPFDENLNYVASSTPFEVNISENTKVSVFLPGKDVFGTNILLSNYSTNDPNAAFTTPGTLTIQVGTDVISVNYGGMGQPQNLSELVSYINSNYAGKLVAFVSQNADGSYSLMLSPATVSTPISATATGDLSSGFTNPNIMQVVKRIADKLNAGIHPDDSDVFAITRSYERIDYQRSNVGAVLSQVKNLQPMQENRGDVLNKEKSDLEDADLSKSIMDYTKYQLAYEALMKIISSQRDMTILRYV